MQIMIKNLAYIIAFSLISTSVFAENVRYYDIEVVIFETTEDGQSQSEAWPSNFSREPPKISAILNAPFPGLLPEKYSSKLTFKKLPKSQYRLTEEAKLLVATNNYKILHHTAWRQPGLPENEAIPVHLKTEYINEPSETGKEETQANENLDSGSFATTSDNTENSRSTMDAYIKVILSRYLHVNIDLLYSVNLPINIEIPINSDSLSEEGMMQPIHYRVTQTRKMRSNELHYIDHPVIGILVIATQYKPE